MAEQSGVWVSSLSVEACWWVVGSWVSTGQGLPGYRSHLSLGFLQIHPHFHSQHGIRIIKSFFPPVDDKQTERWE